MASVRPALKAGLLPLWRDRETVQFGIDPRRAVALTGLAGAVSVLRLLDGSRDRDQVIVAARDEGIPAPLTEQVLALLAACGVLDDYPAAALGALTQEQRGRLAAELAAAALARGPLRCRRHDPGPPGRRPRPPPRRGPGRRPRSPTSCSPPAWAA